MSQVEIRYQCAGCTRLFEVDEVNAILTVCPDKPRAFACRTCTPFVFQGALDHCAEKHQALLGRGGH